MLLTIINPGAEDGLNGWTEAEGHLWQREVDPTPYSGGHYFCGDYNSITLLAYQDVAIPTELLEKVDSGSASATAIWWEAGYDAGTNTGFVGLTCYDGGGGILASHVPSYPSPGTVNVWRNAYFDLAVPAGTRVIRVSIHGIRHHIWTVSSYVDNISLDLSEVVRGESLHTWPLNSSSSNSYGYSIDSALTRTPFATAHPRQAKRSTNYQHTYSVSFLVTQEELRTAKVFLQAFGFKWFTMPLITGQEATQVVSDRIVRLIEDEKVQAVGFDTYELSFKVEEMPPLAATLGGVSYPPVVETEYYSQEGCSACSSSIPALGRMNGYAYDVRTANLRGGATIEGGAFNTQYGGANWGNSVRMSFMDMQYNSDSIYRGVGTYAPGVPTSVDVLPMSPWPDAPDADVYLEIIPGVPQRLCKLRYYFAEDDAVFMGPTYLIDGYLRLTMETSTINNEPGPALPIATFKVVNEKVPAEGSISTWPCHLTFTQESTGPILFFHLGGVYEITVHGLYHSYPDVPLTEVTVEQWNLVVGEVWATVVKWA
jgi:hypothetical protein